jgi:glyoxylase-like metal-dependent hydrolase (beta-lactamase superfamily II)
MSIDRILSRPGHTAGLVVVLALNAFPGKAAAQESIYSSALLPRIRAAVSSMSGSRPREVRYISVAESRMPLSYSVAGADTQLVTSVIPAFQIRYADRWIMVDAGIDSSGLVGMMGPEGASGFSKASYDTLRRALQGADRIVLTHEHPDHADGVQHGPSFREIAAKLLLNTEQRQALVEPGAPGAVGMSPDSAVFLRAAENGLVHPLAPGVVLVKAPGHTPGSQFVYVRLADDREILLVGDLVWMMAGLTMNAQKPMEMSQMVGEDRAAIQPQIDWVRSLPSTIAVVPSHDKARLEALVGQGVLRTGLDLRRR